MEKSTHEIKALLIEYQNGNEKVLNEIIDIYYPYINLFSKSYNLYETDIEDLYSAGFLGLIKAIKTCNVSYTSSFDIYIKKIIAREIFRTSIKMQSNRTHNETYKKIYLKYITIKNRTNLSDEDIARRIGISKEKLDSIIKSCNREYNENMFNSYENDLYLIDDCIDDVSNSQLVKLIDGFCIDEKSKEILYLKYGLYDGKCWTLSKIADKYNVDLARISQILNRNISYIRKQLYNLNDNYIKEMFSCDVLEKTELNLLNDININYNNSFYNAFSRFDRKDIDYVLNNLLDPSQKRNILCVYGNNLDNFDKNSKYLSSLYQLLPVFEDHLIDVYLSKKSDHCVIFNKKQLNKVLKRLKQLNEKTYDVVYNELNNELKNLDRNLDEVYVNLSKIIYKAKNNMCDYVKKIR